MPTKGRLSVIATPIGNLDDLSPRAATTLGAVDLLLCEDTRHTGKLLRHMGVKVPCRSLHAHNEAEQVTALVALLEQGQHLGLVSDAGTPCLSDPGARLVDAAHAAGAAVETLPGPFAVAAGLAASGLNPVPMTFWGFPPKASAARRRWMRERLSPAPGPSAMTHAIYVPGRDLRAVLADLEQVAPQGRVVIARELTKLHESYLRGTPAELKESISDTQLRGEAVVLIEVSEPLAGAETEAIDVDAELRAAIDQGVDRKPFLRALSQRTGQSRRTLYARWVELSKTEG